MILEITLSDGTVKTEPYFEPCRNCEPMSPEQFFQFMCNLYAFASNSVRPVSYKVVQQ